MISRPYGRLITGTSLILILGFAAAPVLFSHDVYSYVDYARLAVVHGLDPYVHPPAAAPADPVYPEVEWTETTSVYGPLFTLATLPLAWLPVGLAVAALKASVALAVLALAALVARLAPGRGVAPLAAAAFVALNPIVLLQVVGGAHNDAIAMLAAMLGVGALLAAREASAGVALTAAVAIKASTAVLAPFALLGTRSRHSPHQSEVNVGYVRPGEAARRLLAGAVLTAAAIGLASYAAFGWDWLDAFRLAGENQERTSHMSVPITTARLTGLDPAAVRAAAVAIYAGLLLYLLAWTWRGGDWLRAAAWASFGLLLATAWLLPWYVVWVLPLAALSRDRPLQLSVIALTAFQLPARLPL